MGGYGYGATVFGIDRNVAYGAAGVGIGAVQVAATTILDQNGALGTPLAPQIAATNGQLVNLITGSIATVFGLAAASGHGGRWASAHPGVATWSVSYGLTALFAGYLVPQIVAWASGSSGRGMRGRGLSNAANNNATANPQPYGRVNNPAPRATVGNQDVVGAFS